MQLEVSSDSGDY
jgi:hypothetical protein